MNIVQTATYQQHVPSTPIFHVSRNVPICMDHCTFWEHYNMSITHCMVCRNLIFWTTYCVIGGALNITAKRRTTTLLQTGMLHVERIALYFVGILFLERSNVFSWRNIYNILKTMQNIVYNYSFSNLWHSKFHVWCEPTKMLQIAM